MQTLTPSYRCALGRGTSREDPEAIKREGWRDQRILVVAANDDRLDFVEREFIRLLFVLGYRRPAG